MSHFLSVETCLPAEELYRRYREAGRPAERAQWHMLWLKTEGQSAREIREVLGYSEKWICETVHRYNEEGPDTIRDRRRASPGGKPMLSAIQQNELAGLLEQGTAPVEQGTAPDGEPWSGPKVARWIESATGRKTACNQRGWEYLRRLGFTPQRPRRRHEAAFAEKQAAFKK